MFPLHAAWHIHGGQKRFFLDYYSVSYSPSFYSLKIAQKRAGSRKLNGAFVAGVENYHSKPLTYARQEAETVARILNTIALINEEVSKESVIRSVTGKTYLHFVCHGSFPWKNDVFTSALHLSDKESLTLVEIVGELDLSEARLVILSACESGLVDPFVPDEALGLPVGFLQAGAAGSISTLWPIDDQSTSLLMESFYNKLIKVNRSPAQALREAQIELRAVTWDRLKKYYASNESEAGIQAYIEATLKKPDDRPYEDPYYWAAFTFNGA